MKRIISWFSPHFPRNIVYMLQSSEYNAGEYIAWFWRARNIGAVATRKKLVRTDKAELLLILAWLIAAAEGVIIAAMILLAMRSPGWWLGVAAGILAAPVVLAHLLVLPLWLGYVVVQKPREKKIIARAASVIAKHPGFKIGIAGSYGKTTFKEILATILAEAKHVAATPGNMNTPLGISRFARKLTGDEDVLIFEMGEYYPGDITQLCQMVRPQLGVITGINEAHLSKFKTLDRTVATIYELADYLDAKPVYKNGENALVRQTSPNDPLLYSINGVNGWKVSDVTSDIEGVSFTAKNGKTVIKAHSALLGIQNIGPLVACIDIATTLGLTPQQIQDGIAKTKAFEHRMEPKLVGGAWVIDDTYNGNSDGVYAGIAWLKTIPAKRRMYVTPGLVEQGAKTQEVHERIGEQLADAADVVVLMQNSVTPFIKAGLQKAGFTGTVQMVQDPLAFYGNLEHVVAAGDVVLMQNDWTDNYA